MSHRFSETPCTATRIFVRDCRMRSWPAFICAGVLAMISADLNGQQVAVPETESIVAADCLLMVVDQAELGAKRTGRIRRVHARLGEQVPRGAVVFELEPKKAQANVALAFAELEQARTEAENPWKVRAAEVELQKAMKESELLDRIGRVPFLEQFRAEKAREKSDAELHGAETERSVLQFNARSKEAALEVAKIDAEAMVTKSPFAGSVVRELKYEGEWAQQGDSIVKLIRMDKLMLQGIVNVADLAPHRAPGAVATAEFKIAGGFPVALRDLVISGAAPEVDLDGNYLVWTFVTNVKEKDRQGRPQWVLRPGMTGKLRIDVSAASAPPE